MPGIGFARRLAGGRDMGQDTADNVSHCHIFYLYFDVELFLQIHKNTDLKHVNRIAFCNPKKFIIRIICYAVPGAKIFKDIEYRHTLCVKIYPDFPPLVFHGGDIAFMQYFADTEAVE